MCDRTDNDGCHKADGSESACDTGHCGSCAPGFHLYEPLVELAGAGARVPLPGFGYNLAKGAMEGADKSLLAAVTGGVEAAAGGISAAIGWGYIISMVFNPRSVR